MKYFAITCLAIQTLSNIVYLCTERESNGIVKFVILVLGIGAAVGAYLLLQ